MSTEFPTSGMPADDLGHEGWYKSRRSGSQGGACVEMKAVSGDQIAVRQSTDPTGPALIFSRQAFADLVAFAKSSRAGIPTV